MSIQIKKLREEIELLKSENKTLKATADELAICIDQLATTVALTLNHISQSSSDPVEDPLDSIWNKDDDGPEYLN